MDDFDRLFNDIERMMRESFRRDYNTRREIPLDINDYGDKITITFYSPTDCIINVIKKAFILNDGKPNEMVFRLPCDVENNNVTKTYNDITGIVDVELIKKVN